LARHLTASDADSFQPANINYGLFTELTKRFPKKKRRAAYAERATRDLQAWAREQELPLVDLPLQTAAVTSTAASGG
jgi:methylenetetrahydrofolate--tRNA-(uracil-5-)-methyltransferase